MWSKIKQLPRKIWTWLRANILNKESILPGLLGELTYWSPLIVVGIIAIFNPFYWSIFGAIYAFWVWLLPAIPIQILFILFYKKLLKYIAHKLRRSKQC
jgi:hypothetical protein